MGDLKRIWDVIANLTVLQIVFYTIPFQLPFFFSNGEGLYFIYFFGMMHFWIIYWGFCWWFTRYPPAGIIIFFIR